MPKVIAIGIIICGPGSPGVARAATTLPQPKNTKSAVAINSDITAT